MQATAVHYDPLTTIELWGALGRKLGKIHSRLLDTGKSWEVFKALEVSLPGFKHEVDRLHRLGMRFAIFRNHRNVGEREFDLGGTRHLRIVPVVSGSKRAGVLQTVVGIVMIVASFFVPGSTPGALAASSALLSGGIAVTAGGVIQLLSPQAKGLSQSASPENLPSYAFGSARNTTASGNPVPICIGERRWGGAIISASILAEDKT
ncbi:tail assembly protein [Pseudomonas putida]|uniref:tail assembly protein n=1 Tax=Pseudomonas putida TaxID=303 RepID=UPI0023642062|nr:tail assembly protein [Pseudomonas putida]MDD1966938.1 tail assembly protein [Pseudomonas putida]